MWLFFIVLMIINGINWKSKSQKHINENPELKKGRDKLFKGWLLYSNIPWVLMGFGMLTGITKDLKDYVITEELNLFVIFYFAVLFIIDILGTRWMFFKGGAESLVQHGFIASAEKGKEKSEVLKMKGMWVLVVLSGLGGLYSMFNNSSVI